MTSYYGDYTAAAQSIIDRVGKKIVLGVPLGLGKPIGILNALYKLVEADKSLDLTIITGLTLARPVLKNELEKSLVGPILERLLKDYEDPLYELARVRQALPKNINVIEFFLSPGKFLHNTYVQQNYISSKYTNVVDDALHHGINALGQTVARSSDGEVYSLGSNTDLFRDMIDEYKKRGMPVDKLAIIGEVNNNMPYMYNDAEVPANVFTHIVDTKKYRTLFALPREEVSAQDHLIGMYSSCLIKDNGCLQIGIGTLSTGVAVALIMRHKDNAAYREAMNELKVPQRYGELVESDGGLGAFEKGIYASTEMLSDEYLHLYEHGLITKRVYDHIGLQSLLNDAEIDEDVTPKMLDKLLEKHIIHPILLYPDVQFLQYFGIFKADIRYQSGQLLLPSGEVIPADLSMEDARDKIYRHCLGKRLKNGKLMHSGFFLGSEDLYARLRGLSVEESQFIDMTRISRTNSLLWNYDLATLQRMNARFVNSAMIITLSGALVSDGLANLQEVSGVGGQFDFVNMAHDLEDARSIITCRSTRLNKGEPQSNVLWTYPNMTIPRYSRDIVITEYGIADCRSKTDSEVIKALLNITDSRYQPKLLKQAKHFGKLASDYHIPAEYRENNPQRVKDVVQKLRAKGFCKPYPFGTELTEQELVIKDALLKMSNYGKLELVKNYLQSFCCNPGDEKVAPYLERMQLMKPANFKERIYKRLFKQALNVG